MEALERIQKKFGANKLPRELAQREFGKATVQDLVVLGLLQPNYRDGTLRLVSPHGDQEFALKAAVASEPAFKVGISELEKDIDTEALFIGYAVSDALERGWTEGSARRNGHAIKKWIFLLYPNLRTPKMGEKAYLHLRAYKSDRTFRGRHCLLSEEILVELSQRSPSIRTPAEIASHLGLCTATVLRWKKKNPASWQNIFET